MHFLLSLHFPAVLWSCTSWIPLEVSLVAKIPCNSTSVYTRNHTLTPPSIFTSRHHCLRRWTFCDVLQVAEGLHRWQRYFAARRKVEARMEQGRPGRDYRVINIFKVSSCVVIDRVSFRKIVQGGEGNKFSSPSPPPPPYMKP